MYVVCVVVCCHVVCVCVFMCAEDLGGLKALRPPRPFRAAIMCGVGVVRLWLGFCFVCFFVCGDDSASASVFVFMFVFVLGWCRQGGRGYEDSSVWVCWV